MRSEFRSLPAEALAGSARDFVSWYEQALAGAFFSEPETLTEFKRIQVTSVQIPPGQPAECSKTVAGTHVGSA